MRSGVLHSYYQVGGESVIEKSIAIDAGLNARLHGPSVTFDQVIGDETTGKPPVRTAQAHSVQAFRYSNPNDLKLSLFYTSGEPRKIDYVQNQLRSGRPRQMAKANSGREVIPWGKEGILEYVTQAYPVETLVFDGLRYEYMRRDRAGWPMGEVRMVLDKNEATNRNFFEAQRVCLTALRAISSRVDIEVADSVQIGTVSVQNVSREQIERAVTYSSMELQVSPLVAEIGRLVLKYKES